MRLVFVTVLACLTLPAASGAAQARPRAPALAPECNVTMECQTPTSGASASRPAVERKQRVSRRALAKQSRVALRDSFAYAPVMGNEPVERERPRAASAGVSMAKVVPALAAKVAEIQSLCRGAHVISAVRHTRIRGTNRLSLHATGEAVDMRGNPSCVYAQLRDWPGGYSTDYGRAQHIHISLAANGREAGLRFAHGGGRKAHRRQRR